MKKLFIIFMLMCVSIQAYPQFASDRYSDSYEGDGWLQKGYRGFVEIGAGGDANEALPSFFINTTHGYQFSEWIFAGAGLGYLYTIKYPGGYHYNEESGNTMLLYVDARLTIPTRSRFYPYVDIKGGGAFFEGGPNGYFNGELGVRYALNENMGLSLGLYINVVSPSRCEGPIMGVALGFDF